MANEDKHPGSELSDEQLSDEIFRRHPAGILIYKLVTNDDKKLNHYFRSGDDAYASVGLVRIAQLTIDRMIYLGVEGDAPDDQL